MPPAVSLSMVSNDLSISFASATGTGDAASTLPAARGASIRDMR
jgi:hypothetical protein